MRSVVLDGNFSAQHRHMRNPEDDVPLADGHAFMVTDGPYKAHLKTAKEFKEVGGGFRTVDMAVMLTRCLEDNVQRPPGSPKRCSKPRTAGGYRNWGSGMLSTWFFCSPCLRRLSGRGTVS